jgi:hypothetical protein
MDDLDPFDLHPDQVSGLLALIAFLSGVLVGLAAARWIF